jgi:hypothetical protein
MFSRYVRSGRGDVVKDLAEAIMDCGLGERASGRQWALDDDKARRQRLREWELGSQSGGPGGVERMHDGLIWLDRFLVRRAQAEELRSDDTKETRSIADD